MGKRAAMTQNDDARKDPSTSRPLNVSEKQLRRRPWVDPVLLVELGQLGELTGAAKTLDVPAEFTIASVHYGPPS